MFCWIRLVSIFHMQHIQHSVPVGENAQSLGQQVARDLGALQVGDWVAWVDADEFINIHLGDGYLQDLIDAMGDAHAIAMNWRIFGSSWVQRWPGMQLDPRFDRCGTAWHKSSRYVKTLFQYDATIQEMRMHRPQLTAEREAEGNVLWMGSHGEPLPQEYITGRRASGSVHYRTPHRPSYDWVQVNHYMVRMWELYALRQARGRGLRTGTVATKKGRRYTTMHYHKHNCNTLRDRSINKHLPLVRAEMQRLLAVPEIAKAHRDALAANGMLPS
jgi:hypothetical protein